MKIKIFDTTNILYKLLNVDILYIQFTDNKKSMNQNEVSTSWISICLNYDNTNVYEAFKSYWGAGSDKYLSNSIQPIIKEENTLLTILNNNLLQLDFTATLINNFVIVKISDVCTTPNAINNKYMYNNINFVKEEALMSSYNYFSDMINMTSGVISITNDVNNNIHYDYININKNIINISIMQPYFKYIDDIYSTENIVVGDYTLSVYDKIFEIDSIDYTETSFIFRMFIKIENSDFLLDTNNVYCNQYTINVNDANNIIRYNNQYTIKLYEKFNDSMFKINDIIYFHDIKNQEIIYIAKINNIDTNNNILTLTNIQNKINVDKTVSNIDDIIITKILNLNNYNDIYSKKYGFNLLENILPVENYIIEPDDYYSLMF